MGEYHSEPFRVTSMRSYKTLTLVALVTATSLVGCSKYVPDSGSQPSAAISSAEAMPSALPSQSAATSGQDLPPVTVGGATVSGSLDAEPTVVIDSGAKPASKLLTADVVLGDGATVTAGSTVTAHYVG